MVCIIVVTKVKLTNNLKKIRQLTACVQIVSNVQKADVNSRFVKYTLDIHVQLSMDTAEL